MQPNPLLERLGLMDITRAVILHVDDVGMCHSSIQAFRHLATTGLQLSASAMVPTSWFPAVAGCCNELAGHSAVDMGVHLTFTSEWRGYRWAPISTRSHSTGLLDGTGNFHASSHTVWRYARPDAIYDEMRAQVERAIETGISVSHIDSHMGTVFHGPFLHKYYQVAREFGIPMMMVRNDEPALADLGLSPAAVNEHSKILQLMENTGQPLLDSIAMMPLDGGCPRLTEFERQLAALPPGVSQLILHPCVDSPELRAITSDWKWRVADYRLLSEEDIPGLLARHGIRAVRWRDLWPFAAGYELPA